MAEENIQTQAPNSDDLSALRIVLHAVKGISPVSSAPLCTVSLDDE